jgi:hypothetical protein
MLNSGFYQKLPQPPMLSSSNNPGEMTSKPGAVLLVNFRKGLM